MNNSEKKNYNSEQEFKAGLAKYKLSRWHSWLWLVYFNMYCIICFINILKFPNQEGIESKMLLYSICFPLFIILCFSHSNIIITLYSTRLKPLLITRFPKQFADSVWKTVYSAMYHPTTIIFTWITIIGSFVYPIFFAIHYAKWWTWLIYSVVLLINLCLDLFTIYNLYDFGKVGTAVYNKYEGEKKK